MEPSFSPQQVKELIDVLKQIEWQLSSIAKSIGSINSMLPRISVALQEIPRILQGIHGKIK